MPTPKTEAPSSVTVQFTLERATKNTVRYEEVTDGPPRIATLYVQKWALQELTGETEPATLTVVLGA